MIDEHRVYSGSESVELPCRTDGFLGTQLALVRQCGHGRTQIRVHPPRFLEEVAEFGWQCAVSLGEPTECRFVDRFGVSTLAHLRQLLRVAQQQQVSRGNRDGNGVRQRELACFVHDEQVQAARWNTIGVREVPRSAADDTADAFGLGDESRIFFGCDVLPFCGLAPAALLRDQCSVHAGLQNAAEHVLDHRM